MNQKLVLTGFNLEAAPDVLHQGTPLSRKIEAGPWDGTAVVEVSIMNNDGTVELTPYYEHGGLHHEICQGYMPVDLCGSLDPLALFRALLFYETLPVLDRQGKNILAVQTVLTPWRVVFDAEDIASSHEFAEKYLADLIGKETVEEILRSVPDTDSLVDFLRELDAAEIDYSTDSLQDALMHGLIIWDDDLEEFDLADPVDVTQEVEEFERRIQPYDDVLMPLCMLLEGSADEAAVSNVHDLFAEVFATIGEEYYHPAVVVGGVIFLHAQEAAEDETEALAATAEMMRETAEWNLPDGLAVVAVPTRAGVDMPTLCENAFAIAGDDEIDMPRLTEEIADLTVLLYGGDDPDDDVHADDGCDVVLLEEAPEGDPQLADTVTLPASALPGVGSHGG